VRSAPCEQACDTNLDLYVDRGSEPSEQSYGCRWVSSGRGERRVVRHAGRGRWYVGLRTSSRGPGAAFKVRADY
jgi:hypothetical protein